MTDKITVVMYFYDDLAKCSPDSQKHFFFSPERAFELALSQLCDSEVVLMAHDQLALDGSLKKLPLVMFYGTSSSMAAIVVAVRWKFLLVPRTDRENLVMASTSPLFQSEENEILKAIKEVDMIDQKDHSVRQILIAMATNRLKKVLRTEKQLVQSLNRLSTSQLLLIVSWSFEKPFDTPFDAHKYFEAQLYALDNH